MCKYCLIMYIEKIARKMYNVVKMNEKIANLRKTYVKDCKIWRKYA